MNMEELKTKLKRIKAITAVICLALVAAAVLVGFITDLWIISAVILCFAVIALIIGLLEIKNCKLDIELAKNSDLRKQNSTGKSLHEVLKTMFRNAIQLEMGEEEQIIFGRGQTHFGGAPDVPYGFAWPVFETAVFDDDEVKPRPLSFLAQFNCADLAIYDKDGLLPKTGLLSFFYEIDSERWGFEPKDTGAARVYYFEDVERLTTASFPSDLRKENRFPRFAIEMEAVPTLPELDDFLLDEEKLCEVDENNHEDFEEERAMLAYISGERSSRILGWPDLIQNSIADERELFTRGYDVAGLRDDIPIKAIREANAEAKKWRLLLQLDSMERDDFSLYFGDCGRLYFYIREEDLKEKRFDKAQFVLQCC